MIDREMDVKIRLIILLEYYKRSCGQSTNSEMHFYVIPELQDIDNKIIEANATWLIDENLVRGGVDVGNSHSFPWITRINPTGIELIKKIVDESELKIYELQDELKDKVMIQDRILNFVAYYFKSKEISVNISKIAKNIIL